jgi:pimeloyl-ACP methyl ester carboxylesterase
MDRAAATISTPALHHGGSGPRLLLLHSGFCTWVEWRNVIATLAREREVLAPTLAGSEAGSRLQLVGRSLLGAITDDLERILDDAGWREPVAVAGSSFGGVVGMELMARGRASSVVALAPPWVAPGRGVAFYMAGFWPILTFRAAEPLYRWTSRSGRFIGLFFHGSLRAPVIEPTDVIALWRSMGRFPLLRVGREAGLAGPGMPDFALLDGRTTLVWGGRDMWVPPWMRSRWQRVLPTAKVVELPDFPHQPHLRDPERIAHLILELV